VDVAQALSDLTEISSQITSAAVVDEQGSVLGATGGDGDRLAGAGKRLLEEAERARPGGAAPVQFEVATHAGSVFLLREGERAIIATTAPEPTVGLVFYDLKSCLKAIDEKPKRKRAPRKKKETNGDAA
jgi:predicted regulator of Ras-like GTPase activity (Roadblock/LC7/MglB family)